MSSSRHVRPLLSPYLLLLIISISSCSAQRNEEFLDICAAASGWSYSTSSSSSASASGGGGSSSSSSYASSICIQAKVPNTCIRAHPHCAWCAQPDFVGNRCNLEFNLRDQGCPDANVQIVTSFVSMVRSSNIASRMSHSSGEAAIRVGDTANIEFSITEPKIYPVDFYYLMDASYSMADDLKNVQRLGDVLVQTLQELTQGGNGSVKLGFGKFVDKVQTPMTQMTPYKLKHPYKDWTRPPFLFNNVIGLTSDIERFQETLKKENVSGNLDPPEGALDAMLQVMECKEVVGWRGNALRLLMVATESAYHYAGDGASKLMGISKSNDGACHTGLDGHYTGAESQDYPTINQVVRSSEKNSITPIFAVGSTYKNLYEKISKDYFRGSTYGILSSDSGNVVDLVRNAYHEISGKQELITTNPNAEVICPWYEAGIYGRSNELLPVDGAFVEGLKSGGTVNYNMSLAINRAACADSASCDIGNVVVKQLRYDDTLTIKTKVIGAFGCANSGVSNSSICSGNGEFVCGMCLCSIGWTGTYCNILDVGAVGCMMPGGTEICSGRGQCLNDRCQCDPGHRHFKERIYGSFCECDDCPTRAGLVCANNGIPVVADGTCSCNCQCNTGWSKKDCGCATTTDTCVGTDGQICSGRGKCNCGACICEASTGYGGPTCSQCLEDCPTCSKFQSCIQCRTHRTGPKNETCVTECGDYEIAQAEAYSIKDEEIDENSGQIVCAAIDLTDNCKFYYTYKPTISGPFEFIAEEEKRCKPSYSLLIVLWCFLLVLLIGLILLCCWRCCVYIIDKDEAKNYNMERLARATMPAVIPLLPVMTAGSIVEFIKAKYLVRRSAKVAVIPVRRSFTNGETKIMWMTYAGSSDDDDFEVLSEGEMGTMTRKRYKESHERGKNQAEMQMSGVAGGNGTAGGRSTLQTVNETAPLLAANGNYEEAGYDWGSGEIDFYDDEEFANIEIPIIHDFSGSEIMFWVELYGQEKGIALGLKRTKVVVIRDEDAGVIGFPKPNYVFKENDGNALIPIHRTVGMDGHISVSWASRDMTALSGTHYEGGRGVVEFADGVVTSTILIPLVPDILYDESEKAFNIELDNPKGGATLDIAQCMVTILCDEECAIVQFPKDAYPFLENCGVAEVNVMRTHSTKGISIVQWCTEDDTAIAGKDYQSAQGTLTFQNTQTEAKIRVPIIDNDVFDEHGRQFKIILFDPSEGTKLRSPEAVVTIIEDDEPGQFEFTKQSILLRNEIPGQLRGKLPIIRSLGCDGQVTIPWFVQNHDNKPIPQEIASLSGSVDFSNQQITNHLDLDLTSMYANGMQIFEVVLLQPTNSGKLGSRNKATVTIIGEEDVGSIAFAQSHFQALASVGMANILVSRRGNLDSAAFVVCETTDQTAISGTHYRGGTSSIVFEVNEAAKEVGIPVYNDPNHDGPLTFGVSLRSTPGGPKIVEPSHATVNITCMPMSPVYHSGFAAPGACTIEFIKSKLLTRKSANVVNVPIHRSQQSGACSVDWSVSQLSGAYIRKRKTSSSSSSSDEEQQQYRDATDMPHGRLYFDDGEERSSIVINLEEIDIDGQQMKMIVQLDGAIWSDDRDEELRLGLRESEIVVLNDVDAGTLGFPKSAFSFSESSSVVKIPVQRLGGMDGAVSLHWSTKDDSAISGRDYAGGNGVVKFANNQIISEIEVPFITSKDYIDVMSERKFYIELCKPSGGAKLGVAKAVVRIVGDQERSIVQFSKSSYPVIGSSKSIQIPVLRTGETQRKIIVEWYTQDGKARQGIDYKLMRDHIVFDNDKTRANIEIPLSGTITEPKEFSVHLQIPQDKDARNLTLGENNVAIVSIISSQEPGTFEFNKPSFLFRANAGTGLVPVIRSNGSDGKIILPWKIDSMDSPSPFAGAEGFLTFEEGQISASVEFGLKGVPSDAFIIKLLPPGQEAKLGSLTQTTVTILGEQEEPTVSMESPTLSLKTNEVVRVTVLREGNLEEPTYVGYKTEDRTLDAGKHYIGSAGNLMMDPGEARKEIMIPIISAPTEDEVEFIVRLTDVHGNGKVGECSSTQVTLQPMPSKYIEMLQQSVQREPMVEFTRERYHFRQSEGTGHVQIRRSDNDGQLTIRYHTRNLSSDAVRKYAEQQQQGSYGSSDEEDGQKRPSYGSISSTDDEFHDWGSGTITFENGEFEASADFVLMRDLTNKLAHFKVELDDPWDKCIFRLKECLVTVMKDKDAGQIGFGSDRYNFSCMDNELTIPIQRLSGADGTVSVPWFTRDVTAISGLHYLPDDGNVVFRDGEVLRKITIPMPRRPAVFEDDEVSFEVGLGDPTGGAELGKNVTNVVLRNDVVQSVIAFDERAVVCPQSNKTAVIKVVRTEGTAGRVVVPWRITSAPGKQKSRYEGTNDEIIFQDKEESSEIEIELPKTLLPTDFDYFVIEMDTPRTGRAVLSNINKCHVTIDNDITSGTFAFGEPTYSVKQSDGRATVTVIRTKGTQGEVSLSWKVKSITPGIMPSVLHNTRGVAEFNPGQTERKVEIPLPKDSENDEENFVLTLTPPGGRAKLGDPCQSELHLVNDVPCTVGFTQPLYETRGDIDNLLVPIVRDGPKGRKIDIHYKTIDGSAKDNQHFIGDEGTLCFAPGEDKKDILVPILNDPSGERVTFDVELSDIQGPGKLGQHDKATVAIDNLAGPGVFIMSSPQMNVNQTKGSVIITILRTRGRKGEVDIPWFVETKQMTKTAGRKPSEYDQLEGTLTFDDAEGQKEVIVPLEKTPQDDDETVFEFVLLTPTTGGGASLGEPAFTTVFVNNDVDGGTVEMANDKVEVFGTNKEVSIPVMRTGSTEHPCFVAWDATDISAIRGKHYKGGRGTLNFEPGEQTKQIVIPIMNDPTGDVMYFNVTLGQIKGGTKLGDKKETQVLIDHVKEHGEIYFDDPKTDVKQSEGKFKIKLLRKTGSISRVIVPWTISGADPMSPYNGLKGQETFKDGETESHIEIDVPTNPQNNEEESFAVQLGQPSGGAFLTDETTCNVRVVNDIMHGKIFFPEEKVEAKQTDEVVEIPVVRSQRTEGRVRVPWATDAEDPNSPYCGLTGIETFDDGEKVSTIKIPLPKIPSDLDNEEFKVFLGQPKTSDAVLGDNSECTVNVTNDIAPALVKFKSPQYEALQSSGRAHVPIERKQRFVGRVIIPWKVVPTDPESPYVGLVGETVIEDGDSSGDVEINLPKMALAEPQDKITIILEDPIGAKLSDDAITELFVENDVGEGVVEMKNRNVTCSSDDGQCTVAVARKLGHDFPATIQWEAEDEDAHSGIHYQANHGHLKFKPGEVERPIHIPLMNDPTGETRHFKVKITDVEGRDKIGEVTECKVRITNEATPPNITKDFDATLSGPQEIKATWSAPEGGAPVEGYKVTYWGKPGDIKTVEVPPEETETTLCNLDPSVSYQVVVRPYNDVGDGPVSNTAVVDTQPELRLSYDTPQQFKTSEKTAGLTLTRNLTTFKTSVECKLVKEIRRKPAAKKPEAEKSSSSSSSSSSSEDETEGSSSPEVLVTSEVYFEPNQSTVTVELPLDQEMRKTSQVLYLRVYPVDGDKEKPLANIELHIINDTGIPGRVRKPFVASTTPRECVVTWEAPRNGGPVEGYKVVAKSEENPDVVKEVPTDVVKVQLENLEPSTEYSITVQPYNSKGYAHPSSANKTTTQDELKVNFSEKHYSFKTSDKVAVIPIKRHFTHGYVTLHWKTQWSKTAEKEESSSSSSDSDEDAERAKSWASGAVSFTDGQCTADVRVPLKSSPTQKKNKTSYFYLYIMDPNKQKRVASQRCELIDDKARLSSPKITDLEAPTPRSIKVSWEPEDNGEEYWVSYKKAGFRADPSRKTAKPEDGEIILEDLEPETTYALYVTAIGDNGQQQSSDLLKCSTPGKVPGPPNRLAFQVLSPTSLQCSWGEPAETNGPITSYDVLYYPIPDDGSTAPIMVRIPDGHYRSLLVEDLMENQAYCYRVRALNRWGCGEFREAEMKIENVGARPPSTIFLNSVDGTYVQQQQEIQQHRQNQQSVREREQHQPIGVHVEETPGSSSTTETSATKTIVTRYVHKDGQAEPEKIVTEYDGKLSQEELTKIAENSAGMEVQVITYNTSRTQSTPGQKTIQLDASPQHQTHTSYQSPPPQTIYEPSEYSDTDVQTEISTDVQEFTDVEESKDGDVDVTTITKTYKTLTTEKRMETNKGMKQFMVQSEQPPK